MVRPQGLSLTEVIEHYSVRDESGCLLWSGGLCQDGYGRFTFRGTKIRAHRVAWELAHGPIPVGLVIDHECHNAAASRGECAGGRACLHRRCIDVSHLAVKTNAENSKASPLNLVNATSPHYKGHITACPQGHEYSPENTLRDKNGHRTCKTCVRVGWRRWWDNRTPEQVERNREKDRLAWHARKA